MRHVLLEGRLTTLFLRRSPPAILGVVLVALHTVSDMVWAGRLLGPEAVGGLTLAFPLLLVHQAIAGWIAGGSAALASRALGASDQETLERLSAWILRLSLLSSCPLLLMFLGARAFLSALGGSGEVLELACAYYRVQALGACFGVYAVSANGFLRALGHIRAPTGLLAFSVGLNLILTPVLASSTRLGISGIGLASVVSSATGALLAAILLRRHLRSACEGTGKARPRTPSEKGGVAGWPLLRSLLVQGLPALALQGGGFLRQALLFQAVARTGSAWDLALFGASFRIYSFLLLPGFGVLQALQPVLGASFGAGLSARCREAYRVFVAGNLVLLVALALPGLLAPDRVLSIFLPEVHLTGYEAGRFRAMLACLPLTALGAAGITFLQAVGQGSYAAGLALVRQLLLFLPLLFLVPTALPSRLDGLFAALVVENVLAGLLLGARPWGLGGFGRAGSDIGRY